MAKCILNLMFLVGVYATGFAQIQSGYGILFFDTEEPGFERRIHDIAESSFPTLSFAKPQGDGKIGVEYEWVDVDRFPIPKPAVFELFAVGLASGDRDRILASKRMIFLNFTYQDQAPQNSVYTISRFIGAVTAGVNAGIWDDETRQTFSVPKWKARRVDSWRGAQADIGKHITMHEYRDPELHRIITLGLRKFGLPDLVLTGIPGDLSRPAGNTVNFTAQYLLERGVPASRRFVLDLRKIHNANVRDQAVESSTRGATGMVTITLTETPAEKGDSANQLFKIEFPEADGADSSEKTAQALHALYGSENEVLFAQRDDRELLAARDQARKAFLKKKVLFVAGLKLNERLAVKYGFTDGKNTEYKWLEVYAWEGNELSGVISSDSRVIEGMKAGKKVKIPASDIYDYLHYFPDGTEEGNETGKILEKREKD